MASGADSSSPRNFSSASRPPRRYLLISKDVTNEIPRRAGGGENSRAAWSQAPGRHDEFVNPEGRIIVVNSQTENSLGYSREGTWSASPSSCWCRALPDRDTRPHPRRLLREPRVRPMGEGPRVYGLRKDGREFPRGDSASAPWSRGAALRHQRCPRRDLSQRRRRRSSGGCSSPGPGRDGDR